MIDKCNCVAFASVDDFRNALNDPDYDIHKDECKQKSVYFYIHMNKPIGRCQSHCMISLNDWVEISYEEAMAWEIMIS
jgi:hypothetical protein